MISLDMNLPIPVVGVDPGPDWALNINSCLTIIDSHDHTSGKGIQITPNGLNINTDLSFAGNNATNLRSTRFIAQGSPLSLSSDLGCLYVSGSDLYFNDASGNQIRMTIAGGVNGSPGSISNLIAPASATYVSGTSTFVWQSAVNVAANMDNASVILRNQTINSKGLTLSPPNAMGSDYSIVLPFLPASQSFLTLDASGNMAAPWTVDNNTIKVVSNQLVVQGGNIPGSEREHAWELNGPYPGLIYPLNNIDSIFFAPFNLTITQVWIYNGTAGSGGTTEYDLKVASSGGSFTSILSNTGKITSAAASNIWTDSNSIIGSQTGVTKPIISTANINAGQAISFDLIQSMTSPATDARIRVIYKQQ